MDIDKNYSRKELVMGILGKIKEIPEKPVRIMEVCGGHTMSIHKNGIPSILPPYIKLVSGPGCPVCVTPLTFIDKCIAMSENPDVIITVYGDLLKVPGSKKSLLQKRGENSDIRIVYSVLDALKIAEDNPGKKTVFPGIGFETTSPASAAAVIEADKKNIDNFYIFSSHKKMQPAMEALASGETLISAFLCPGHVSTIAGTSIYKRLAEDFKIPCVVSGFEPVDILNAVFLIMIQINDGRSEIEIAYKRAVKKEGNIKALNLLSEVFETCDSEWRGLGIIPESGLVLKGKYAHHDAEKNIQVKIKSSYDKKGCICGEILKGLKNPPDCPLFGSACTTSEPLGACMVSSEGSCAAWYRYGG